MADSSTLSSVYVTSMSDLWLNATLRNITNSINLTTTEPPPAIRYSAWLTGILSTLAAVVSLATVCGNILVVLAFILDRNIRQPSNYLIASLAITDILIGLFSMPLYTLYLLKGTWPLGQVICDLWLSLDYTVCLVSQYTVFLITLDRFCMVKAPAKYRNWRTKNKIKVMISATWLIPALIFFTSIMGWNKFVGRDPPDNNLCEAQFQTNPLFTAILVISYYWITLVIMVGLYVGIYRVALKLHHKAQEKRARIKAMKTLSETKNLDQSETPKPLLSSENKLHPESSRPLKNMSNEDSDFSNEPSSDSMQRPISNNGTVGANSHNSMSKLMDHSPSDSPIWKPRASMKSPNWEVFNDSTYSSMHPESCVDELQQQEQNHLLTNHNNNNSDIQLQSQDQHVPTREHYSNPITAAAGRLLQRVRNLKSVCGRKSPRTKSKSENRARKALRTITFILGAFVACWTPYHVIVLIDAFCRKSTGETCVNTQLHEFSYWFCYCNSPVNPFCYALANYQFKQAFIRIIKGEHFGFRKYQK